MTENESVAAEASGSAVTIDQNHSVKINQCSGDDEVMINQCQPLEDSDQVSGIGDQKEMDQGSGIGDQEERDEGSGIGNQEEVLTESQSSQMSQMSQPPAPSTRHSAPCTRPAHRRTKGTGGLQLEKSGMWTVRAIVNGKRISKSTGTKDRAEAEQFAKRFLAPYVKDDAARTYANIQAAVMTERQLAEMREEEGPQLAVKDAWEAYVASPMRRDLAQTTLHAKEQVVRVFVEWLEKFYPEVTEVRHLTHDQVENYLNYLRADHSASTYNNRLCVLREVYRTIMKRARAKENPWEGFPLRADDSHTRRELTIEELARLVDMASREGFEWRTLFGIAMYTGLRLGDCCKLAWSEVDIVRSVIQKIPEKTKKYRKGRPITVPIHKVLADLLMQTPVEERTGYVLPQIGAWASEGINGMGKVHSRISKIFRNAGIVTSVAVEGRKWKAPEAGFHSLRHTFVSMSANAGVPLHIVQSIVGHESSAMTRHYYHENVAALQQAVEAIPSIGETGEVTPGEVAQPDARRLVRPGTAYVTQPIQLPPPVGRDEGSGIRYQGEGIWCQVSGNRGCGAISSATRYPIPDTSESQPATVVGEDGVERANPGADAPLVGRSAERNAVRRENKLAVVERANAAAATMGGWGDPCGSGMRDEVSGMRGEAVESHPSSPIPHPFAASSNRRQRTEWIGRCIRRWCNRGGTSLLDGTTKLVGNGGYRFLQELWDKGVPILPEDAIEAMDVFLRAKGAK